ncbi:MAG: hypothetical protein CMA85_00730 [Euryarchaeota archaeon]|nr:hypothetical protein [Euryarchaeota archaeon]
METVVFTLAIWGAVALFGGTDDDTVMMTDFSWGAFEAERAPLVLERNAAIDGDRKFRARCIEALDKGDRREAESMARKAYDMATRSHELARSIERLARDILVTPPAGVSNIREATSRAIGKLPNTLARQSYEELRNNPLMPSDQANRLKDLILLSPDGPFYSTLVAQKVIEGRFEEAEATIARCADASYHYSQLIGDRFVEGEGVLRKTDRLWSTYSQRFQIDDGSRISGSSGGKPGNTA